LRRSCRTNPDHDFAILIRREALSLDEFNREVLERRVIQLELPLERAVGDSATSLEQTYRLVENLLKGHCQPSLYPMRRAEDGAGIAEAVRTHVYRKWP